MFLEDLASWVAQASSQHVMTASSACGAYRSEDVSNIEHPSLLPRLLIATALHLPRLFAPWLRGEKRNITPKWKDGPAPEHNIAVK